jgi:hypothetical protein
VKGDRLFTTVALYRGAFGPASPEVAVALHTFADVELKLHDERVTPAARAALEEAIRIRRAALGPDNPETLAAEERLGGIRFSSKGSPDERDPVNRVDDETREEARR